MSKDRTKLFVERRVTDRVPVRFDVNYRQDETYLFSQASNISELGIFLATCEPAEVGTEVELQFKAAGDASSNLEVRARVMWVEKGEGGAEPGMGLMFLDPEPEVRDRIRALIRTMAYLD